jgi:hypothetical protein
MNPMRFLVFGLQSSGKTTFAAALWHLLDSREVPTMLQKGAHSGNFRYLEEITQEWSEGWRLERTASEDVEIVHINLRNPKDGSEFALEFTDLAGESFEKAFANRLAEESLVEVVNAAEGILLFVSAARKVDDLTILEAYGDSTDADEAEEDSAEGVEVADASEPVEAEGAQLAIPSAAPGLEQGQVADIAGAANGANAEVDGAEEDEIEQKWNPADTPLQVQLVDLLQAHKSEPFVPRRFRIAVIVSAWDLSVESSPDVWLATKYPLLDQFLRGPEGAVELRVFGVSAQGGKLSKRGEAPSEDRQRLMKIIPASKRIQIVGQGVRDHDLTSPICWLGGMETEV